MVLPVIEGDEDVACITLRLQLTRGVGVGVVDSTSSCVGHDTGGSMVRYTGGERETMRCNQELLLRVFCFCDGKVENENRSQRYFGPLGDRELGGCFDSGGSGIRVREG